MANFAQLGIEITSSGVDKAQSELDALANSGGKAEASLKGVEQAATSTDSTVKKLSDSALYRANQSIARYSQGLRDAAQESERAAAAARNESDVIAALARERAKAADFARANADATRQSTKATVDWAAEQQRANARAAEMVAQDAKRAASAQKANAAIQDQQRDLAKLLGQIDPTVAALGRLDEAERKLAGFRKSGALDGDAFTEYNAKLQQQRQILGGVSDAQGRAGMSARAYSAAMRNVPAQITDITTSLIGGQPAYLVALQQGGQLKDMFGGIVPAAKALGSTLLSMINPVTALAAVVGVLGVAWYQAGQRTDRINEALISTGRFAKTSADDIKALADSIDGLSNVSGGKAISAVTALATTTQLTGDALTSAAAASVQWATVTGQSVDSVVDKFRAIQKDPLKALTDLNAAEQFLTETQYQRIKALQDEGQWQDAATEAAKIYADVVAGRAQEIQANLGGISVAWQNIKTASSDAWGAVISGADAAAERIGATTRRIAGMNSLFKQIVTGYAAASPTGLGAFFGVGASRATEVIMPGVDGETRTPDPVRNEAEAARAKMAADAWKQRIESLDTAARLESELVKIQKEGVAAGRTQVEIDKLKAQYTAKQAEAAARTAKSRAGSGVNSDDNSANTLLATAQRQIEANNQLSTSGEKVTASGRLVIQINQRLTDTTDKMTAATRAQLVAVREKLTTSDAEAKVAQQTLRDTAANIALTERLASAQKLQADQNQVALMGIGRGSQAAELAQRELNIRRQYLADVEKLEKGQRDKNTELSASEYTKQKDLLAQSLADRLSLEQSYQDQRMAMQSDWRNGFTASFEDYSAQAANVAGQTKSLFDSAFKGAEDAMVKFAMTGKLSFKDFANSIIAELIRIAAKQAVLQIAGAIAGAFGGGASAGVGSTQLGNNYNWGGGFSGGGYTGNGGKYQPAGIVHAGEVVWSQKDVAAVGGPRAANAMRPTAGYANGGGPGLPQSLGIGQMSAPQITFNMNMQDGTITSQQQGGNADESTRELKQMFEAMINAWWTKNNRPGGAAYNMRMGTA